MKLLIFSICVISLSITAVSIFLYCNNIHNDEDISTVSIVKYSDGIHNDGDITEVEVKYYIEILNNKDMTTSKSKFTNRIRHVRSSSKSFVLGPDTTNQDKAIEPKEEITESRTLNTGICLRKSDLSDDGGNYIKSVCQTIIALSYHEAKQHCINHGMTLFIINDRKTEDVLYKYADSIWSKYFGAALWINGEWNISSRKWITDNKGFMKPLFENLRWWVSGFGNCLRTFEEILWQTVSTAIKE